MTPTEHAQRIRELEFKLYKAEHGMGMPYSREDVAHYRNLLEQARKGELVRERLSGKPYAQYVNAAMERGTACEPEGYDDEVQS